MKREGKLEMTYNLTRDKYSICQFNQYIYKYCLDRTRMWIYPELFWREKEKYEMTYNFIREVEREDIARWGSRSKNKDQVQQ